MAAVREEAITHLHTQYKDTHTHTFTYRTKHTFILELFAPLSHLVSILREKGVLAGRIPGVFAWLTALQVRELTMSWDCGLRYMFSVSPALQPGGVCVLHDKEDQSRLEMVQRLAKDGCRFLQSHSKAPERTSEVRRIQRCYTQNTETTADLL